jgi:hypothetical protein
METKKLKWEIPALRDLGGIEELTQGGGCSPYGGIYGVIDFCTTTGSSANTCSTDGASAGTACTTTGSGF